MTELLGRFTDLPSYGIGALIVLILYAVQSEIRFGKRARTIRTGPADRNSTAAVSLSAAIPVLGFVLAMKSTTSFARFLPAWFTAALIPGLPATAWAGVALGCLGLAVRLWAVLTLRHRYTRTLLIQDAHAIERGGPYRWVRHPGYLGSLLALNGIALASGNWIVFGASLTATIAAYSYRIGVEDTMLISALGEPYAEYRRRVHALIPLARR